jgi:hypothetical protein
VAGQTTSSGGTAPNIGLATAGTGAATYAYPASVQVDTFGRVVAATAGTNPAGTYLPLAGGTMSGAIAMGTNAITGASAVSTTLFTLANRGMVYGTQGAAAIASQNLYMTDTGAGAVALAPMVYKIPDAGATFPVLPAYNGENWIFSSTFNATNAFTVYVNSTATSNIYSVPAGFYIHFVNRKASPISLTVASVANPLVPVGAVNTVLTLPASRDSYVLWNGTTWTAN